MKLSWFKETFATLSYYNIIRRDICSLLIYDPYITKKSYFYVRNNSFKGEASSRVELLYTVLQTVT